MLTEAELANFEAKIAYDPISGCHIWTACLGKDGYGMVTLKRLRKTPFGAHRVAKMHYHGWVPQPGEEACHKCDNPCCVNPDHIFIGSSRDNQADKVAKKRQAKGSKHGRAKRTEAQIKAFIDEVEANEPIGRCGKLRRIAEKHDLPMGIVKEIRAGKIWKHVR